MRLMAAATSFLCQTCGAAGKLAPSSGAADVHVAWTSVLRMALVKAKVLEIGPNPTLPYIERCIQSCWSRLLSALLCRHGYA